MSKSKAARRAEADHLMDALPAFSRGAVSFAPGADGVGTVADRLGKIAALKAELAGYEEKLKEVIIELGDEAVEGKLFRATLSIFDQTKLDTAAIRCAMDAAWIDKHSTTSRITQVRVKARTGALLDA
jgi:hypothetical protein